MTKTLRCGRRRAEEADVLLAATLLNDGRKNTGDRHQWFVNQTAYLGGMSFTVKRTTPPARHSFAITLEADGCSKIFAYSENLLPYFACFINPGIW